MSASRSDAVQEMRAAALKAAAERGAAEVKAAREAKLAWEIANSHFVASSDRAKHHDKADRNQGTR